VAQRAALVAERDAAVHAATRLLMDHGRILPGLDLGADAERDGLDPDGTEAWNQILEATTRG
jgi:hypothetical protein